MQWAPGQPFTVSPGGTISDEAHGVLEDLQAPGGSLDLPVAFFGWEILGFMGGSIGEIPGLIVGLHREFPRFIGKSYGLYSEILGFIWGKSHGLYRGIPGFIGKSYGLYKEILGFIWGNSRVYIGNSELGKQQWVKQFTMGVGQYHPS